MLYIYVISLVRVYALNISNQHVKFDVTYTLIMCFIKFYKSANSVDPDNTVTISDPSGFTLLAGLSVGY